MVRIDHEALWQALESAIRATEEPLVTTSVLPMWHLCRLARQDVTVVLTGQGSDELLGGYRRYQGELWREIPFFRHLVHAAGPLLDRMARLPDSIERSSRSALIDSIVDRFESEYAVFSSRTRQELIGRPEAGRASASIQHWLDWSAGEELSLPSRR